jgi:glycine/D-amino acid oxidase-like deaminating enzyme
VGSPHASLWWATLAQPPAPRAPLDRDLDVDVAIVGAGFTGLWTALFLARLDPSLRVAVLEAGVAGAGASGRNGGWASALYPVSFARIEASHGRDAMRALRAALRDGVTELDEVARQEGIDCDYERGGTVTLARSAVQAARLRAELESERALGATSDDVSWLDAPAARERCGATDVAGALFTPHCASVHPAKLVTGLADAVARRGVEIYEDTTVTSIEPGDRWRRPSARSSRGTVRADVVVRATEGYTSSLPGARRALVPLYSLVVATDPLPSSFFNRVGLAHRETFCDARHLIIYGQRTKDDRLVFGGRGAPYHFGSRVDARFDDEPDVFAKLEATLVELFGELPGEVPFRWGGALGAARDFSPFVRLDRERGVAAAGGYVGDGVVLSHVAGRTLAELITGATTERTDLPFVGHAPRNWEPEPLRWLGINAGLLAADLADRREASTGRASGFARVLDRLQGD